MTEAQAWRLMVNVLERWTTKTQNPFMCNLLRCDGNYPFAPRGTEQAVALLAGIPKDMRNAMKDRILSALPSGMTWDHDAWDDVGGTVTLRIIAAQWFALEAAEEGK